MARELLVQRKRYGAQKTMPPKPAPVASARGSVGEPLGSVTRAYLEPRFGHNFGDVRVHTDGQATEAAAAMDAAAFTVGTDVYVHADHYAPESPSGLRLLAHELTHVVQHERFGPPSSGRTLSERSDVAEREAETAADRVAGGQAVAVQAAPVAPVARGLLDWVEDKASGAWDDVTAAASAVGGVASDVGSAIGGAASDIYGGMKANAGFVGEAADWAKHGIDWAEDEAKGGVGWLADKAEGIPVLDQVAHGAESVVDTAVDFGGGVLKGATDMAGGVLKVAADPVDAARGIETMAEHVPILGDPLKAAHGLLNVATGDETLAQLDQSLDPLQSLKDDVSYVGKLGAGVLGPMIQSIKAGKPGEAAGEVAVQVAALLGTGGAGEAAEGTEAADAAEAAEATQAAEGAQAAHGAEAAEAADAAEAAKAAEAAEAAKGAQAAEGAEAAKGAEAAEEGELPEWAKKAIDQVADAAKEQGVDSAIERDRQKR